MLFINLKKHRDSLRFELLRNNGEDYFRDWDKEQLVFEGSADDFHNYAVILSRFGFYSRACQALEEGIKQYPKNADVIASFLVYGMKCEKAKECKEYYDRLIALPDKNHTWRSFRFAVSYLIERIEGVDDDENHGAEEANCTLKQLKDQALKLVGRAKKRFPKDETHYLSEFEIYEACGEQDKGVEELKKFLSDPQRKAKVAPKCHLKYVDVMMEQGEYEEVLRYACNGAAEAAEEQESVDTGYFFYLYALALDAYWLKARKPKEEEDKKIAGQIMTFYQTAYDTLDDSKESYFSVIRKRFRIAANLSDSDRQLNDWRRSRD